MPEYKSILSKFSRKKIVVIGDLILDQYIQGSVSRISPEAPVPVVLQKEEFFTPGGAANVASNLHALGAKVTLIGKIGADLNGQQFSKVIRKLGISTKGIFVDKKLPTVSKTRVLAQHQQIVRIDREETSHQGEASTNNKIFKFVEKAIADCDAVIISDYGKGLITPELVRFIVSEAVSKKKIITVDPKVEHFGYYRHVTAITPNRSEAENAIRNIKVTSDLSRGLKINFDKLKTDKEINKAGEELVKCLDLQSLLITLSDEGMRLFEKGKAPVSIKTKSRDVFDVSGAGDTVISTFTLSMAAGASKKEAAEIANIAAGIVVGKMGAVAITKKELQAQLAGTA